ncbi:MAG TPA: NAD-dependent DNA ligase LigA, partial [Bacteroides sp.]|nr:NAD-dependent DNA ligase LigA [Bacteroides sp.]
IKNRLEHFISRRAMDIHAAEATIDLLYREGMVRLPSDLYHLDYESVVQLERFAEKSAKKLLQSIEDSKQVPFHRVLYALGIRYVGETVARKLAEAFGSMEDLMQAGKEQLTEVDEIGERIAESVVSFFSDPQNREMIGELKEQGLQFRMEKKEEAAGNTLEGKTFVISGVFEKHSREELKTLIVQHGGRNTGSVSKQTDYILAGRNMGPGKLEKAQELGISIISEEEFLSMIARS